MHSVGVSWRSRVWRDSCAALDPSRIVFRNFSTNVAFAMTMAMLIALVGAKGLRVKSPRDVSAEIGALELRRQKLERWINK
jgi:hypothetical protein